MSILSLLNVTDDRMTEMPKMRSMSKAIGSREVA